MLCHIVFVFALGMNVILSPPLPVKCPRQVIAEEILKQMREHGQKQDQLTASQKRC